MLFVAEAASFGRRTPFVAEAASFGFFSGALDFGELDSAELVEVSRVAACTAGMAAPPGIQSMNRWYWPIQ
jgi:hypothetical protein